MELSTLKNTTFLNDWLSQISSKVEHIPDNILAEALRTIETKNIPTLKNEAYRNIPIESILKKFFKTIHIEQDIPNFSPHSEPLSNIIFLHPSKNSYFIKESGIHIYTDNSSHPFQDLIGKSHLHQQDVFAALNTAYCPSFIIIHIHQSLQYPLYIYHHISPLSNFNQNRVLFIIDQNTKCTVFENFNLDTIQPTFYNLVEEIFVSENAHLQWINLQNNTSNQIYSIQNTAFILEKSTHLSHHQISLNGALWRNNLNIHINNENIDCNLKGLSIGKKQSIINQNTAILHHSGYSNSNQLYKNIADEKSNVIFNGFIMVNKNAIKTNAYQNSKNLLLSDNASIFAKPQLEIYADDVKCSHGSSTGALNDDAMFYLQSRGIDKSSAQKLLLQAFYSDIIESIENTKIQQYIVQNIHI